MKIAYEEHLSFAALAKADVDFIKLKLLTMEKNVVDLSTECVSCLKVSIL